MYAGSRREMDGQVGDVITDSWYGWEEKLQLTVVAKVHKHLCLPEVVLGGALRHAWLGHEYEWQCKVVDVS